MVSAGAWAAGRVACAGVSGPVGGVDGVVVHGGGGQAVSAFWGSTGAGWAGDGGALLRGGGGRAGGGPLAGFGVGEEQHVRLADGAADDDLGAADVLRGLRRFPNPVVAESLINRLINASHQPISAWAASRNAI